MMMKIMTKTKMKMTATTRTSWLARIYSPLWYTLSIFSFSVCICWRNIDIYCHLFYPQVDIKFIIISVLFSKFILFLQEDEGYDIRNGKRRSWDDEFVLKRQFSALIPAFDPRPGRTNVNQTTELPVPIPGSTEESSITEVVDGLQQPRLRLTLRGPNLPGVSFI